MGLEAILQTAANAAQRANDRRGIKKTKANPSSWRIVWQDTLVEYYPEAGVSYTTTDAANLKRAVARGVPLEDVGPMLEWAVKNWEKLRLAASFGKRPTGPAIPDMKWLIYAITHAHAGYKADRDAATLDLSKRRESLRTAPEPEPAPAPRPLRRLPPPRNVAASAPIVAPRKLATRSPDEIEQLRKALNLPKWRPSK